MKNPNNQLALAQGKHAFVVKYLCVVTCDMTW